MEIKYLQVLVMSNGEILCGGQTVGYVKDFEKYLFFPEQIFEMLESKRLIEQDKAQS